MRPVTFTQLCLRVLLGSVFIVSGFQKLISPAQNFAAVIEKFNIVPAPAASAIAQVFPWFEFVLGVLFALGLWTRASLFLLWAMNTAFIGLLSSALARKLPIDECGCFGEAVTLSPKNMLAVDIGLWFLFLIFFFAHRRVKAPSLDERL